MSAAEGHAVIRPLRPDDLDRVLEIEESCYPFPWTRGIFSDCLRVGYACFGLQLGSDLAGYSVHNWAAGESHLLNLCVDGPWQRRGYGSMLLEHAINHARALDCHVMFLEVRPSNPDARALYLRRGFEAVGERPEYYQAAEGRENAVVMRLDLIA
ncbi:MAG: ribosomal protein S18-alanine N-acetyltransferase [Xanthomonadales bacterium]|nr:ribosomal protein S18-alanine N-acetyltransferase [Xanthomonadales bacterium]NIX14114.1 ribosomal protein S18-alanine N-acetyltransferase [Xanthomonadales bacterium]